MNRKIVPILIVSSLLLVTVGLAWGRSPVRTAPGGAVRDPGSPLSETALDTLLALAFPATRPERVGEGSLGAVFGATDELRTRGQVARQVERHERRLDVIDEKSLAHEGAGLADGSVATLRAYLSDLRRVGDADPEYTDRMLARVERILAAAEAGSDALAAERGSFWRGYRSRFSVLPQLYSIYVPESYDGTRPYPVVVSLHGGSTNHNVWMAQLLGNKIATRDYWKSHRKRFEPRVAPEAIIVSPNGFGQVRWRWMAESDVFDVLDDVRRAYNVDDAKVFLHGLSNGGIGSYTIGLKHASRFAGVLPQSGIVDWLTHHEAAGRLRPAERTVLRNESPITWAENAFDTHLEFYHGARDRGFTVDQPRGLASRLAAMGVPFSYHEIEHLGHDLVHVLWRNLEIMKVVKKVTRPEAPARVRLVSASPRANRQFWVVLDDRADHTRPGRLEVEVANPGLVRVTSENASRFTLELGAAPVLSPVRVEVDGVVAWDGALPADSRLTLDRPAGAARFVRWDGRAGEPGTRKAGRLVGPLADANYEPQLHVYGTLVPEDTPLLEKAAHLGARNWVMARAYSDVRHPVIADRQLTPELMRDRVVVLYGHAGNNLILQRVGASLPIKVGDRWLELRGERLTAASAGARFICPNPLAPSRYLVVQAGNSARAVEQGGRLPIYIGDYLVYDEQTTRQRSFMVLGPRKEIETGFFDETWRLPAE